MHCETRVRGEKEKEKEKVRHDCSCDENGWERERTRKEGSSPLRPAPGLPCPRARRARLGSLSGGWPAAGCPRGQEECPAPGARMRRRSAVRGEGRAASIRGCYCRAQRAVSRSEGLRGLHVLISFVWPVNKGKKRLREGLVNLYPSFSQKVCIRARNLSK